MKKFGLLIIAAATLVACSTTTSSGTTPNTPSNMTSIEELKSITLNYTEYTLNITKDETNPTVELSVTTNPSSYSTSKVTWTSTDSTVATVDENGVVKAVNIGNTVITAKVEDVTATCEITVSKDIFNNIIDKDVTEFGTEELNNNLYRIKGVVENINSISNIFRVMDTNGSGKYVAVNRIGYQVEKENDFVVTSDKITYESKAVFDSLEIEEGNYVTIVGIYYYYANTYYFDGYLENITDGDEINYTASVSSNNEAYGTAALSKAENIKWNEEVEVITSPAEGYAVGNVTCNDMVVAKNESGKYVFNARSKNEIKVTFIENKIIVKTIDFSNFATENVTLPSSDEFITIKNAPTNSPKYNATAKCLILDGDPSGTINGNSVDTIKDFGGNISKVVVTAYGQRNNTFFYVYGSNDAYTEESPERTWTQIGDKVTLKDDKESAEFTIEVTGSYKYIRVQCGGSASTPKQTRITSISYYIG